MSGINPDNTQMDSGSVDRLASALSEIPSLTALTEPSRPAVKTAWPENQIKLVNRRLTSSYASAVSEMEEQERKHLTWDKLVAQDKVPTSFQQVMELESVLDALRQGSTMGNDNRVIIPANCEKEFSYLFKKLKLAAEMTGSKLIPDTTRLVRLVYPEVWSEDSALRTVAVEKLNSAGKAKDIDALQNLAMLVDALGVLPEPSSLQKSEVGKHAQAHLLLTIAGIYAEQKWDKPLAATRKWWKIQTDVRALIVSKVGPQVGGAAVAELIINAVTVLYRRFLRQVLTTEEVSCKAELESYLKSLLKKLCCDGSALFSRLLRQETFAKKVQVIDPVKKGKVTKTETRNFRRVIRPKLLDSPMTEKASSLAAKVNRVLATVEAGIEKMIGPAAHDYHLPNWEKSVSMWVEELYLRCNVFNRVIHERKLRVRHTIFGARTAQKAQSSKTALFEEYKSGINPKEWFDTIARLRQQEGEEWEAAEEKAFRQFFSGITAVDLDTVFDLSEPDIRTWLQYQLKFKTDS